MRRAFVTGVAGFLGSHVAEHLRDLGHEVTGIDNLSGGQVGNVPEGVEFGAVDCLDADGYADLLRGADLVVHCAASAYDGLSHFSPGLVYRDTLSATVAVVTAAVRAGVGRIVHCSSMSRYGALPSPFTEDQSPAPVSPYGLAKVNSEQFLRTFVEHHGGEWAIAVPHNIIGPRQRFDDPYRNVAAIMINRMLRGMQPVIYGDGSSLRCFSFVADCVSCLGGMALLPQAAGEVINIGPDEEPVTILHLAERIAALLDFDLDPKFVPARPGEVTLATCSSDKARRLLGYRTTTGLDEGLLAMIEWIDAVGPREFVYDRPLELVTARTPTTWVDRIL
ncbi:MAG: NAD-dependent epimerase/dehydratase family protein [Jatrophihabitans sp.]|uniref:NAD-dependent epimerase/dehydratase family protein n=1 Tax=Jatrophihabitans sp. TaxID=1932789 RepID=UPI003F7DF43C